MRVDAGRDALGMRPRFHRFNCVVKADEVRFRSENAREWVEASMRLANVLMDACSTSPESKRKRTERHEGGDTEPMQNLGSKTYLHG